jgi:protein O-mannosyl-transferase
MTRDCTATDSAGSGAMATGVAVVLCVATMAAYWGLAGNDFASFDDGKYVTGNDHVKAGLTVDGLVWAFTDVGADYWHPLSWLSHMLDVTVFGMWAGGHHLVSLAWHIANTLLLFGFLRYVTQRLWPSAFVAAMFALHPLHVESVAWVTERKDMLSTFFLFAMMWTYAVYARKGGWWRYVATVGLFAMGLMCKPMLVTVPVVLLILDYWPLKRLTLDGWRPVAVGKSLKVLILEKVPFAALAGIVAVITIAGQRKVSTMASLSEIGIVSRLCNAVLSYAIYIRDMVWPANLAVLYPYSRPSRGYALLALVFLVAITVIVAMAKRRRYLLAGWLWYLVILLPVCGIMQVGPQSHADRYTYVSLTGLFIGIAWLVGDLAGSVPAIRVPVMTVAAVLAISAAIATHQMVTYWKDGIALANRALSVTGKNYLMDTLLARLLYEKGDFNQALRYCGESVTIQRDVPGAWLISGMSLTELGRLAEAERSLRRAIEIDPSIPEAYAALAKVMGETDRLDEGILLYTKALAMNPKLEEANFNLAVLYTRKGNYSQAARAYEASIAAKPSSEAWNGLGDSLVALGEIARAENAYRQSIRLEPGQAVTHYNLAVVLSAQDRKAEALTEAVDALRLAPDNPDAQGLYRKLSAEPK